MDHVQYELHGKWKPTHNAISEMYPANEESLLKNVVYHHRSLGLVVQPEPHVFFFRILGEKDRSIKQLRGLERIILANPLPIRGVSRLRFVSRATTTHSHDQTYQSSSVTNGINGCSKRME